MSHSTFITNRIEKLKTAIFSNFSESILKFPTCIIRVTGIDESGYIWFIVKKPYDDIRDFDMEFPAQLQFYNKNYAFHITVHGKATIMPEKKISATCAAITLTNTNDNETFIRFRIFKAEYFYGKMKKKSRFNNRITDLIISLFTYEREYHSLSY